MFVQLAAGAKAHAKKYSLHLLAFYINAELYPYHQAIEQK